MPAGVMDGPPFCRSCGAPITWVHTERFDATGNRKRMPLDRHGRSDGNIILVDLDGLHIAHVLRKDEQVDILVRRFTSHFVTCEHAAEHRKPKS